MCHHQSRWCGWDGLIARRFVAATLRIPPPRRLAALRAFLRWNRKRSRCICGGNMECGCISYSVFQQLVGCSVGADFVLEDLLADGCDAFLHSGCVVESVFELAFDGLVQDAEVLLLAFLVEIAVLFGEGHIVHHVVPQLLDAVFGVGGAELHLDCPL